MRLLRSSRSPVAVRHCVTQTDKHFVNGRLDEKYVLLAHTSIHAASCFSPGSICRRCNCKRPLRR